MFLGKPTPQAVLKIIEKLSYHDQVELGHWLVEKDLRAILTVVSSPLTQAMADLRGQFKTQQADAEQEELEKRRLNLQIENLSSQLDVLKAPFALDAQFQSMQENIDVLKGQLEKQTQQKEQLALEKEELKGQVEELENQVEELEDHLEGLEEQVEKLKPINTSSRAPIPSLANSYSANVVVTKNSRKFHKTTCPYLVDVAPQFKTFKTKSAAVADGGRACRTCCP